MGKGGEDIGANKYRKWLEPDNLILLEGWARRGYTDAMVADKCDINVATLYDWKKKFPEINDALKNGKELVDIYAENALLRRALGYETEEVRQEVDEAGHKRMVKVTKTIPPDVTALIFWLKNRRPDLWRDRPEAVNPNADVPDNFVQVLRESAAKVWRK